MTDDKKENLPTEQDIKFMMRTGRQIKDILLQSLRKEYGNSPEKMARIFMFTLTNSVANIINDFSEDEKAFKINISVVIDSFNKYLNKEDIKPIIYNAQTDELMGVN